MEWWEWEWEQICYIWQCSDYITDGQRMWLLFKHTHAEVLQAGFKGAALFKSPDRGGEWEFVFLWSASDKTSTVVFITLSFKAASSDFFHSLNSYLHSY